MTRRLPALVLVAALSACGESSTSAPQNRDPFAAITADPITVKEGDQFTTSVTLSGALSSDPDGDGTSARRLPRRGNS